MFCAYCLEDSMFKCAVGLLAMSLATMCLNETVHGRPLTPVELSWSMHGGSPMMCYKNTGRCYQPFVGCSTRNETACPTHVEFITIGVKTCEMSGNMMHNCTEATTQLGCMWYNTCHSIYTSSGVFDKCVSNDDLIKDSVQGFFGTPSVSGTACP